MKKLASLLLSAALLLSLAACGRACRQRPAASTPDSSEGGASSEAASSGAASSEAEENTLSTADPVRIAGLKGPTTMGLVNLLPMQEDGSANLRYDLQLYGAGGRDRPPADQGRAWIWRPSPPTWPPPSTKRPRGPSR